MWLGHTRMLCGRFGLIKLFCFLVFVIVQKFSTTTASWYHHCLFFDCQYVWYNHCFFHDCQKVWYDPCFFRDCQRFGMATAACGLVRTWCYPCFTRDLYGLVWPQLLVTGKNLVLPLLYTWLVWLGVTTAACDW